MAVPKYRPSSQRQGRRRKQHQGNLPELSKCPHCEADKLPYFACPSCGKYGSKAKKQQSKKATRGQGDKVTK